MLIAIVARGLRTDVPLEHFLPKADHAGSLRSWGLLSATAVAVTVILWIFPVWQVKVAKGTSSVNDFRERTKPARHSRR